VRRVTLSILSIACAALVGCAAEQDRVQCVAVVAPLKPYYEPAPAAALAFDPPIARNVPLAAFSREDRSPSAFYGYELPTVDTYYLYQRDQIRGAGVPDRYDRTTYSGRSSLTYR
jgi:hypothetical protein